MLYPEKATRVNIVVPSKKFYPVKCNNGAWHLIVANSKDEAEKYCEAHHSGKKAIVDMLDNGYPL